MSPSNTCRVVFAANLLLLSSAGFAYEGKHRDASYSPEDRLVREHRRFAGSKDNAEALVEGLRYDKPVELSSKGGSTTKFTSPTGKMGWGNVDIALNIAEAKLAEHGIRKPSPAQIEAALNGGKVTTKSGEVVKLPGVLKLRASGMGWGQVAQKHGLKLGEVMHHGKHGHWKHGHKHADWKHGHKHADWKHGHKHSDWNHGRGDWNHGRGDWKHTRSDFHRARFDRPDSPHKFDRPERPVTFDRPDRPYKFERPERHHRR